jgi:DNA-binding MarR family transcriptional regulator
LEEYYCLNKYCINKNMSKILQQRLGTTTTFQAGEEIMLALGLAISDLGAVPEQVFKKHELNRTDYNVLRMLRGAESAGLSHGDITRRLISGVPDVTRLMDRLVKKGLARRERISADRRKVIHKITEEGLVLLGAIDPHLVDFHAWLATVLDAKSRVALVRTCERLIEAAQGNKGKWE